MARREILKLLGTGITCLRGINRLPPELQESIYVFLIPPDLFDTYGVDPISLLDREGNKAIQIMSPPGQGTIQLQLKRSVSENDPIVFIQLSDTRYGQINFEWVIINDLDSGWAGTWSSAVRCSCRTSVHFSESTLSATFMSGPSLRSGIRNATAAFAVR